jgi:hypothetical protein
MGCYSRSGHIGTTGSTSACSPATSTCMRSSMEHYNPKARPNYHQLRPSEVDEKGYLASEIPDPAKKHWYRTPNSQKQPKINFFSNYFTKQPLWMTPRNRAPYSTGQCPGPRRRRHKADQPRRIGRACGWEVWCPRSRRHDLHYGALLLCVMLAMYDARDRDAIYIRMAPWLVRHVNDAFVQGAVYINTTLGAGASYSPIGVSLVLHFYLRNTYKLRFA